VGTQAVGGDVVIADLEEGELLLADLSPQLPLAVQFGGGANPMESTHE
jgi:hypothetical protein